MRHLIIAALLLGTGGGQVFAQIAAPLPPASSTSSTPPSRATAVADCVQMWDRGTHMTKQEWSRTCERVQNRLQNLQLK